MGATGTTAAGSTPVEQPEGFDFTKLSTTEQLAKVKELQKAMGQIGFEAGDPNETPGQKLYVNTGKSMCINAYCNSDGETFYSKHAPDWSHIISESWVKNAISKLDKGMKPLSESIKGYKFTSPEAFGKMVGLDLNSGNIKTFMEQLKTDKSTQQKTQQLLQNVDYLHKGYTSMTYIPSHGTYDNMPIRMDFVMRKGVNAIVTNNHPEHEIVGGRNQKYNFVNMRVEEVYSKAAGKIIEQMVVDVYI